MFGKLKNWLNGRRKPKVSESAMLEYLRKVQEVVRDCYPVLTRPEVLEIEHLIYHNENGEALLTLATIISQKNAKVPRSTINTIRSLIDGFAEAQFLPDNLDQCAIEQEPNS
jgi:hypothetical protein